ncbi:MAG: PAS sensor protein [Alistipes sp.]
MMTHTPSWVDALNCAVTVCDTETTVIYQNDHSRQVNGEVCGKSLIPCHNERSRALIRHLLDEGGTNTYTIEKRGVHKMIYQTAWLSEGKIGGLVEFSMEIPAEMPHYVRSLAE